MTQDTVRVSVEVWVDRKDVKAITEILLAAQLDSGVEIHQAQYSHQDENAKPESMILSA